MGRPEREDQGRPVALLAEGVDRNRASRRHLCCRHRVALLAEGVDRNKMKDETEEQHETVALLAEGVDRNCPENVFLRE